MKGRRISARLILAVLFGFLGLGVVGLPVVEVYGQGVTPSATMAGQATVIQTCVPSTAVATRTSLFPTVSIPTFIVSTPLPPICVTAVEPPYGETCYTATPSNTGTPMATNTPWGFVPTGSPTVTVMPTVMGCSVLTQTAAPSPTAVVTWQYLDSPSWASSGYSTQNNASDYGGSHLQSNTVNNYVTVSFTGSAWELKALKNSDAGKEEVYIDDVLVETVDLYNGSLVFQQTVASGSVAQGYHTIKVKDIHQKNGSSSNYYVNVDALRYASTSAAATSTVFPDGAVTCGGGGGNDLTCNQWETHTVRWVGAGVFEKKDMRLTPSSQMYGIRVTVGDGAVTSPHADAPIKFTSYGGVDIYTFPTHSCGAECTAVDTGTYNFLGGSDGVGFSFRSGMWGNTIGTGAEIWASSYPCVNGATATAAAPTGTPSVCMSFETQAPIGYVNPLSVSEGECYEIVKAFSISAPDVIWDIFGIEGDTIGFGGIELCLDVMETAVVFAGINFVDVVSLMITVSLAFLIYREIHS